MKKDNSHNLSRKIIVISLVFVLLIGILTTIFLLSKTDNKYASVIEECRTMIIQDMAAENIPGLSVAIVDKEKVIWSEGFGYTDIDKKKTISPKTLFSIQSTSKTITATAQMVAVQDGLIDLDKPISAYIPDFTVNSRYDDKPVEKITIRNLLSHTAGFTQEASVGNNIYPESPSFDAHIKSISDTWLRYPIGQRYSYSNLGIDLSGYILQVTSGMTFPNYVKEKLLDPIGMKSSSFDMETIRKNEDRAIGHNTYISDVPLEVPMIPSGGFYSNALDMAAFVRFHLNKGMVGNRSVLSPEFLDEMYTIPFPAEGQDEGYALGIVKGWDQTYRTYFYNHNGGGFGFLFSMTWYPDYGIGLIILTNNDSNSMQSQLANQIMRKLLSFETPMDYQDEGLEPVVDYPIDYSMLKNLSGNYYGRFDQLEVLVDENVRFSFNKRNFIKAEFYSSDECRVAGRRYRFITKGETPPYIIELDGGATYDYNGPADQSGPNKKEWESYIGKYTAIIWGQAPLEVNLFLKDGYLFIMDSGGFQVKLYEYEPGLFFTSTGECVDLRGESPMFANLRFEKENAVN